MRSALVGIVKNAGLAGCKAPAGILGHPYALVADAVESMLDVVTSLIVWLAGQRSAPVKLSSSRATNSPSVMPTAWQ